MAGNMRKSCQAEINSKCCGLRSPVHYRNLRGAIPEKGRDVFLIFSQVCKWAIEPAKKMLEWFAVSVEPIAAWAFRS